MDDHWILDGGDGSLVLWLTASRCPSLLLRLCVMRCLCGGGGCLVLWVDALSPVCGGSGGMLTPA